MNELGFKVYGVDVSEDTPQRLSSVVDDFEFHQVRILESEMECIFGRHVDIVISSLPYHQTEVVANYCIDNGIRYCDLGGRVDVSQRINDRAKEHAKKPVFTDLGLAPGLVNILAEHGYNELYGTGKIVEVEMMVGGLPDYLESNRNPLRYALTWSTDGLINEYKDDCLILQGGEPELVGGMSGLEHVDTESLGPLEAFYTSGGASHTIESMKRKGVMNCHYKTLRYKGHCDIVKFLIKDCNLDKEALEKIFTSCGIAQKDEVIILAKVHKDNKSWTKEKLVKSDDKFSAMQKATAFPISSVAALMAEGKLEGDYHEHRDYYDQYPKSLSYANVPFEDFHNNLKKLNFNLDE
jgi:saccharopine dehydrogenase-like NADP-dependent oxidoreductase